MIPRTASYDSHLATTQNVEMKELEKEIKMIECVNKHTQSQ